MKNILKSLLLLLLISCGSSSQYWEEYKFEDHVDIVDLIMSYKEQNPEYDFCNYLNILNDLASNIGSLPVKLTPVNIIIHPIITNNES